jgi:molybdopterin-guanine dinucleotide biosynthesis protein A
MSGQNTVSGVVLAGGLARRMGQQDKGLLLFNHRPLVSYPLAAMHGVTDTILISANRNQEAYRQFGYPVISDADQTFDGPLAGILAAMQATQSQILLVMPCDSPLLKTEHLLRLLAGLDADAEIAVAFDGVRLHSVVLALKTHLQASLQGYLKQGQRKLQAWLDKHELVKVDFSDEPEVFTNINSMTELLSLESAFASR